MQRRAAAEPPADEPLWEAIAEALIEPVRADGASFSQPSEAAERVRPEIRAILKIDLCVVAADGTVQIA